MATRKVTVTLDELQLGQIRRLVDDGGAPSVSGFVQRAVAAVLDDVAVWDAMLAAALGDTDGPLSDDERVWADEQLSTDSRPGDHDVAGLIGMSSRGRRRITFRPRIALTQARLWSTIIPPMARNLIADTSLQGQALSAFGAYACQPGMGLDQEANPGRRESANTGSPVVRR